MREGTLGKTKNGKQETYSRRHISLCHGCETMQIFKTTTAKKTNFKAVVKAFVLKMPINRATSRSCLKANSTEFGKAK